MSLTFAKKLIDLRIQTTMDFPEIKPGAFYGRKRVEVQFIRGIPSDSEDSELSDDEDQGEIKNRRHWAAGTRIPQIADVMPINRFEELKRFIHFSDNNSATKNTDKIEPVLNQIRTACQKIPFEEHLSCDEQIIPFKGRISLRTYNPKKPHKWGYKMYILSGVSGFTSNFELCSNKADLTLVPGEPNLGAASNIIVRLCRPIPRDMNHKVYYDNYFSSLYLLAYLQKLGIQSVATLDQIA
ncbi:unnamed protein product [Acanthoscelides obtectus]|uniref:PiggyBac transposable element-derived protein domain-containing protein n=1 Tax=Acanthoscelides obtectus TaxID=200917 RepID=A0A9P0PJ87_ACAOB|nr:unnamed protein product [Acanthoscelides obtectus]CAK1620433.1 PiggyBac transposable element-derived protein 3 [Acanthoscelides obtectus]